ncbi:DUF4231 domain-containing protein [Mycoplasma todarodis]|uniref:DUF4231 domain-containing protein n=1 Tax=Mycoplasma todarodis TaxID=1937191 RepID=A0A4R0XNC8_9MOLU|nr:DUF4231 domain-containing protein [Mycoplasma todarodis]TCG10455.1 hypothetical protein C4B25_04155 [Mycoplasma todarodis]
MQKNKIVEILQKDDGVMHIWNTVNNKYRKSRFYNTLINSTIFILTATLVLINLWAMLTLKNPPYNTHDWQWARNCFLIMAIITAVTGLLTSALSIFKFKDKTRQMKDAINSIKEEYKEYKLKDGRYADIKNKDQVFIEFVSESAFIEF